MRKKYFLFFFLLFFLQFSFWPVVFGLSQTPAFLLAFLVILSGKVSFKESFLWFLAGGLLVGYFSPWSPLLFLLVFPLLNGTLFFLEKLFLWQRESFFLEGILLLFSKLFFDGTKLFFLKIPVWLNFSEKLPLNNFVFKEYVIELGSFVIVGLVLFFCFRHQQRRHYY